MKKPLTICPYCGKDLLPTKKTEEKPFDFKEELFKLKDNKRKDFKIIALYWRKKGWVFENRQQFDRALRRELRPAKDLEGYSGDQIGRSMLHCEKNYKEWSLETVFKRIQDIINKK